MITGTIPVTVNDCKIYVFLSKEGTIMVRRIEFPDGSTRNFTDTFTSTLTEFILTNVFDASGCYKAAAEYDALRKGRISEFINEYPEEIEAKE